MNGYRRRALFLSLALSYCASTAFSQQAADPLLAKLNALPPDERHSALVKGAQSERLVEWYATLPANIRNFSSTRFASIIHLSRLSRPALAEADWSIE